MTDEQTALSRRVVACKGWRWMPGMRTVYMASCDDYEPGQAFRRTDFLECVEPYKEPRHFHNGNIWYGARDDGLPDLTDAATIGCLLALVRKAWRCPTVYARQSTTRRVSDGVLAWEVCDLWLDAEACRALGVPREGGVGSWGHGSEAEALVAALESAP